MLKGTFKVVGVESRTIDSKTYSTVSLRASDLSLHKVDSTVVDVKNYVDHDVMCVFNLKWGKYSAGIELIGIQPVK